jgi:hypothetical protein
MSVVMVKGKCCTVLLMIMITDRQCTYTVTSRRLRITSIAVENNKVLHFEWRHPVVWVIIGMTEIRQTQLNMRV